MSDAEVPWAMCCQKTKMFTIASAFDFPVSETPVLASRSMRIGRRPIKSHRSDQHSHPCPRVGPSCLVCEANLVEKQKCDGMTLVAA